MNLKQDTNIIIKSEGLSRKGLKKVLHTLNEERPRERMHSKRVSILCQYIGDSLNLSDFEVNKLKLVGLLHDIGKIRIEGRILNKPGMLTDNEYEEIKKHSEIGYRILSYLGMRDLADIVLSHHERWDGTGYPRGLKGESIPVSARIIALADGYDAMTSRRPYKIAMSEDEAITEIRNNFGLQFDPEIARVFIEKVLGKELD